MPNRFDQEMTLNILLSLNALIMSQPLGREDGGGLTTMVGGWQWKKLTHVIEHNNGVFDEAQSQLLCPSFHWNCGMIEVDPVDMHNY